MSGQIDDLTALVASQRVHMERLEGEKRKLARKLDKARADKRELKQRLRQNPSEVAAERDALVGKLRNALQALRSLLHDNIPRDPLAPESDSDYESDDPLDSLQEDLADLEDDDYQLDSSDTNERTLPSLGAEIDTSSLPSPPQSEVKLSEVPSSSASYFVEETFKSMWLYFAEKPPPQAECTGFYSLSDLCRKLELDSATKLALNDLCTATDLNPRIWLPKDNVVVLYQPTLIDLEVDDDTKKSYFIDWGVPDVVERLERRILDTPSTTAFHVFVQPRNKLYKWYYYGALHLNVMDTESLDLWARELTEEAKESVVEHLQRRSQMGNRDISEEIETGALVQMGLGLSGRDENETSYMNERLRASG